MLIYSLLHLTGYDLSMDEIKRAIEVAEVTAESRKDVEELKGMVSILIAKMVPPEVLSSEVSEDLVDDPRADPPAVPSTPLAGAPEPEPADFVRHSCEPNCGMHGNTVVVALRDIAVGEQVAFDHAMANGSDFDEFECQCGTASCRGKVTGNDWMLPELQLPERLNLVHELLDRAGDGGLNASANTEVLAFSTTSVSVGSRSARPSCTPPRDCAPPGCLARW